MGCVCVGPEEGGRTGQGPPYVSSDEGSVYWFSELRPFTVSSGVMNNGPFLVLTTLS